MGYQAATVLLMLSSAVHVVGAQSTQPIRRFDLDHPADFRPAYRDKTEWEQRAQRLRTQTLVAAGLWPMPPRTSLEPLIHGRIQRDGYTVEKVSFASLPGHYVTGNLYRPIGFSGARPAVLSPHGHWPGGRFMWRSDADARNELASGGEQAIGAARSPLQARCAMLARMGCIVFHYDMLGYGDSTAIKHREGFSDIDATLRLQSQLGLQTWNSIRALDFLCGLPDVDASRIAVTGASGGGTQTFLLCAVDERPAVSFPAVMVSMEMQGGCVCENAPLLRVETNNVELACLSAPRPLAMTGANDWTRHIETRGLPEARHVYSLYGAADRVAAKYFPFEHNFNHASRQFMYEWLNTHLKLGLASPIQEAPIEPIPSQQLSVYDDAHPRPADERDVTALRQWMRNSCDRQLDALRKDPPAYREHLLAALSAMLAYDPIEMPAGYETIHPVRPSGRAVVWVSRQRPQGAALQKLMEENVTVYWPSVSDDAPGDGTAYAGFTLGYNRSSLAQHAVNVLQTVVVVSGQKGATGVDLLAIGSAGPAAALACALAGDRVRRAVIDLDGFDFDQLTDPADGRILPGAVKYGGMNAFVSLCSGERIEFLNRAGSHAGSKLDADAMAERLLK